MNLIQWNIVGESVIGTCGSVHVATIGLSPLQIKTIGDKLVREIDVFSLQMPEHFSAWGDKYPTQESAMFEAERAVRKFKRKMGW